MDRKRSTMHFTDDDMDWDSVENTTTIILESKKIKPNQTSEPVSFTTALPTPNESNLDSISWNPSTITLSPPEIDSKLNPLTKNPLTKSMAYMDDLATDVMEQYSLCRFKNDEIWKKLLELEKEVKILTALTGKLDASMSKCVENINQLYFEIKGKYFEKKHDETKWTSYIN